MAIKSNSLSISESGITISNAYSKVSFFTVIHNNASDIMINASMAHYANSSSRAAGKSPVKQQEYTLLDCNDITGSLASGSISYVYDKIKLEAPFSGSTITDV